MSNNQKYALMSGKDKVISGLKHKALVAVSNLLPDGVVADNMPKQARPSGQGS